MSCVCLSTLVEVCLSVCLSVLPLSFSVCSSAAACARPAAAPPGGREEARLVPHELALRAVVDARGRSDVRHPRSAAHARTRARSEPSEQQTRTKAGTHTRTDRAVSTTEALPPIPIRVTKFLSLRLSASVPVCCPLGSCTSKPVGAARTTVHPRTVPSWRCCCCCASVCVRASPALGERAFGVEHC